MSKTNNIAPLEFAGLLAGVNSRSDMIWAMDSDRVQQHAMSRQTAMRVLPTEPTVSRHGTIAVVPVVGVLMPTAEFSDEVDTRFLAASLRALAADDSISAVVLSIDSPGGAAMGMTDLAKAADELAATKPLLAHAEFCVCSGAFWLASRADQLFTGDDSRIGSIGTRIFLIDVSKMFEANGAEAVAIDTGPFKSMGAFGTPLTAEHRSHLQGRVDGLQLNFSHAVQTGFDLNDTEIKQVADGQVFTAVESQQLRLSHGVKTLSEVVTIAADMADSKQPLTKRTNVMSKETPATESQAATTSELKKTFPKSSAEWREEQTEAGATLAEASVAYAQAKEEELESAQAAQEAAEEKAEAAEKKAAESTLTTSKSTPKKKGNQPISKGGDEGEETVESLDYVAMAREIAEKKSISFRQAALDVQKRHGTEARESFKRGQLVG